jgi:hypothetical protein
MAHDQVDVARIYSTAVRCWNGVAEPVTARSEEVSESEPERPGGKAASDDALSSEPTEFFSPAESWAEVDPRDPGVLQILAVEHSGLLSARSLVYNESFARVASFLTLVSMSFVGLALIAQARGFDRDFLVLAAIIMVFDLLVGLATIARVLGAIDEDLRALHGMSRLRHAYLEVAPYLRPYFTTPVNDDARSVLTSYGKSQIGLAAVVYFFSTSVGLMVLIVSVLAGLASAVGVSAARGGMDLAVGVGVAVGLTMFFGLAMLARRSILAGQAALESHFPSPQNG